MPESADQDLPETLKHVRTRPLFVMRLAVRKPLLVGGGPQGFRRISVVSGGSFAGERLSGEIVDGGSDWQFIRADGTVTLDVRLVLRTRDNVLIGMTYQGFRHGPREEMERIDRGEVVDPARYYFRINPVFESADAKFEWLNRIVAVGIGHRRADGPIYSIFEVL